MISSLQSAPFRRSPMLTGMQAFYKQEEASGSALDTHGGFILTDNNTVTSNPGFVGNARQYTRANSESHSIADNTAFSMGIHQSFVLACRCYADSFPAAMVMVGKDDGASREYDLYYTGSTFELLTFDSGGNVHRATAVITPSTATWYSLIGWYDDGLSTLNLQIDNGTVVTTTGVTEGARDQTAPFSIGSAVGLPFDGRIDEVTVVKGVWTAAQRAHYFRRTTYPFIGSL